MNDSGNKRLNDDDDDEDYSWDYDDDSEDKPKVSEHILISLTRDWLGRENPDSYPTHGFFPVWAFALLIISGKYFLFSFYYALTNEIHQQLKHNF